MIIFSQLATQFEIIYCVAGETLGFEIYVSVNFQCILALETAASSTAISLIGRLYKHSQVVRIICIFSYTKNAVELRLVDV